MRRASQAVILATLICVTASPATAAETICGWIQNPVPREWTITDSRRTFTIMQQNDAEDAEPAGMDRIGDLSEKENLNNGRTACGCLRGVLRGARIAVIQSFVQKRLSACRSDPSLPSPQN